MTATEKVTATRVFDNPSSLYVKCMVRRSLWRWAVPGIIVAAVLGVAAFSDIRYGFLLLIVLLVVYPMVMVIVWIAMVGKPAMIKASRPQRWVSGTGDTFDVEYFRFGCDKENPGEPIEKIVIAYTDVKRARKGKQHSILWLRRDDTPLLVIPTEYLETLIK